MAQIFKITRYLILNLINIPTISINSNDMLITPRMMIMNLIKMILMIMTAGQIVMLTKFQRYYFFLHYSASAHHQFIHSHIVIPLYFLFPGKGVLAVLRVSTDELPETR